MKTYIVTLNVKVPQELKSKEKIRNYLIEQKKKLLEQLAPALEDLIVKSPGTIISGQELLFPLIFIKSEENVNHLMSEFTDLIISVKNLTEEEISFNV